MNCSYLGLYNSNHNMVNVFDLDQVIWSNVDHPVDGKNCRPSAMECSYRVIPQDNTTLCAVKLPLGVVIQPLCDDNLIRIQHQKIVRCTSCRAYLNPFICHKHSEWYCNFCYATNSFPVSFKAGSELVYGSVEYIAPSDYMVRPPQPLIHVFLFDVSHNGCKLGYLPTVFNVLLNEINKIKADSRARISFILFDSQVHFIHINNGVVAELIVPDIEDTFIPTPSNLILNIQEVMDFLSDIFDILKKRYEFSFNPNSSLGAALLSAFKLLSPIGGRVCVFQSCIPNHGPGTLHENHTIMPTSDFYKSLALDFCMRQISVDLFILSFTHCNLTTLKEVSQFSSGAVYHLPFHYSDPIAKEKLESTLRRYLNVTLGLEAVLRLRCSNGISINKFHGSCFMRSRDLLSLPIVNSDLSFGIELSINKVLKNEVCLQAALLYTSTDGARTIRVHTLCLPVSNDVYEVLENVNQRCVFNLVAKMVTDKILLNPLHDVKSFLYEFLIDLFQHFSQKSTNYQCDLYLPNSLAQLPLLVFCLITSPFFGQDLDKRAYFGFKIKTLSSLEIFQLFCTHCYRITSCLEKCILNQNLMNEDSSFILDTHNILYLYFNRRDKEANIGSKLELSNFKNEGLRRCLYELIEHSKCCSVLQIIFDKYCLLPYVIDRGNDVHTNYYEMLRFVKRSLE